MNCTKIEPKSQEPIGEQKKKLVTDSMTKIGLFRE